MALSRSQFFASIEKQGLALTFDDVRLVTGPSKVSTRDADTVSRFTRGCPVQMPIISAAMDTVTESSMAIAMARSGGLGIIHAGLTPEKQMYEVKHVKLNINGCIDTPVCINERQTLQDVLNMCAEKDFLFRSFPVIDEKGVMVGLVTQNDFDFSIDHSTKVKDVMTPISEAIVADKPTTLRQAFDTMRRVKKKSLPLVNEKGEVTGMYRLSDVRRLLEGSETGYSQDQHGRLRVGAAVPTDDSAIERIKIMKDYLDVVVLDSAQGDSIYAVNTLKSIKKSFPDLEVMVGNVSSGESALMLAKAGADGIKVGQGPGSICTTRIETGIGTPQISAVNECAKAVEGMDVPICADGGITQPGDISLAIAAGASTAMLGSKLAGTKEAPGKVVMKDGAMVKYYRGMGSASALRESAASRKRYGVNGNNGVMLAEGVESYVPYKGRVGTTLEHYVKALRKSMSYVGSKDIETHRTKARFVRITASGYRESHPHDVQTLSS